jgi:ATP-binding cassette subfamily B protein RaxB
LPAGRADEARGVLLTTRYQASRTGEEGMACLVMAAAKLGEQHDLRELRAQHPVSPRGITPRQLIAIAASINLSARLVRCTPETIGELATPAILQWEHGGFVLLERVLRGGGARIFDPARGRLRASAREVRERLVGEALELSLAGPVAPRKAPPRIGAWSLFRWNASIGSTIVQAIVISIFAQFYAAVSPMYLRIVLDDVVVAGSRDLLGVAALGFALLAIFNAGASVLRGIVLQNLNMLLNWDMGLRVFRHMLRLPLEWFQRRRLADILSRLQGVDQVRSALGGVLGAAFDATLAVIMLAMLLLVSPLLAAIAVGGFALLVGIRLAAVPIGLELNSRAILTNVAEQGKRIETLRAIQSIKAMAGEPERESDWMSRFAEMLRAAQRNAVFNLAVGGGQGLVASLMMVAAIYFGASAVLDGRMSVGMLTAAIAYLTQFSQSASNLFQQVITWRMLDVQLDRLSDVVLEPTETNIDRPASEASDAIRGSISAEGLCFRYGPEEPLLFDNLDLTIEAGEHVAIVGPSGVGKSTLLKVLTGLYRATGGTVRIDGRPLDYWGPRAVRGLLGVVMQDDELLLGSIAENVAFFDEHIDIDRVWECLAAAGFESDVQQFPLTLDTMVGDMGSALSGGQKQRLLIARALYRRPRMLILDEATSHLDLASERTIVATLNSLRITRIVVAHRPDTIAAADRVLRLGGGNLVEERNTAPKAGA